MYAKIIEDLIDCTDVLGPEFTRKDKILPFSNVEPAYRNMTVENDMLVLVRVLDDDRIPYFELIATKDDETLENVLTWCMNDAGATILQLKNEQGEWYDYMN